MRQSRKPIKEALTALLDGVTFRPLSDDQTKWAMPVSRRLKLWSDAPLQPACFITVHAEDDAYQSETTPSKTTINAELFVYFKTNDPTCIPADDIDSILDGIDAALKVSPVTGKQDLSGTVSHCRREGRVMLDPGDVDGQGIAVIPLKIFVP